MVLIEARLCSKLYLLKHVVSHVLLSSSNESNRPIRSHILGMVVVSLAEDSENNTYSEVLLYFVASSPSTLPVNITTFSSAIVHRIPTAITVRRRTKKHNRIRGPSRTSLPTHRATFSGIIDASGDVSQEPRENSLR